jgi:hypothetical protein
LARAESRGQAPQHFAALLNLQAGREPRAHWRPLTGFTKRAQKSSEALATAPRVKTQTQPSFRREFFLLLVLNHRCTKNHIIAVYPTITMSDQLPEDPPAVDAGEADADAAQKPGRKRGRQGADQAEFADPPRALIALHPEDVAVAIAVGADLRVLDRR